MIASLDLGCESRRATKAVYLVVLMAGFDYIDKPCLDFQDPDAIHPRPQRYLLTQPDPHLNSIFNPHP
jgi:hypothetical protein